MNYTIQKQLFLIILFSYFQTIIFGQTIFQHIPADASVIMSVDLGNLDKKIKLESLSQFDFYKGFIKEIQSTIESEEGQSYTQTFFSNPIDIGYNMLKPFSFLIKKENGYTFYTMVLEMGDQSKYEQGLMNNKGDDYKKFMDEMEGFNYWSEHGEAYAWNEHLIINVWAEKEAADDIWSMTKEVEPSWEEPDNEEEVIIEEPAIKEGNKEDEDLDGWEDNFNDAWAQEEKREAMANWANKIMNRKFTSSIATHANYKLATVSASDLHFWMDYNFFLEAMQDNNGAYGMLGSEMAMAMDAMQGASDILYSNSNVSMALNFQNGKIGISSEMFVNEDMKKFYNGALDAKFNKKFLRYIEGGDQMFGYFFMNYSMKNSIEEGKTLMHKALKEMPEFGQMADDAMSILGIFIDEDAIANLWKGDLLIAVSGTKMMEVTEQTFEYDEDFNLITKDTTVIKKLPIITALASYGNEKNVMKFVKLGVHSKVIEQLGNYYKIGIPEAGLNLYMALKNGVMIFTNDKNLITAKLEKGIARKQRLNKHHRKLLCENSSALYWDIPNTLYAVGDSDPANMDPMTGYLDMFAKQFESIQITSSKEVENSVKGQFDFNFVNKNTNSLEQFFNFVNDIYIEIIGGARI